MSQMYLGNKGSNSKNNTMRCIQITQANRVCKRNCTDGIDFCKQHNPLNKLDDITCAICLDPITYPMKMNFCTHVFCKTVLVQMLFTQT